MHSKGQPVMTFELKLVYLMGNAVRTFKSICNS